MKLPEDLQVVVSRLEKGDVVVIKSPELLDGDTTAHIQSVASKIFDEKHLGFPIKVLVLSGGLDLEVVRSENA